MKKVVLNQFQKIVGVIEVSADQKAIQVAGARTITGQPVNRTTFKLSASKANFKKAEHTDLMGFQYHENGGFAFYTCMSDSQMLDSNAL